MAKGDLFWRARERKDALREAEAKGAVADSMEVRKALMARVHGGEISLSDAQAELARIKRNAGRLGLATREEAYRGQTPTGRG